MKKIPFNFMPAAFHWLKQGGLGAYIRYKSKVSHDMRVKHWTSGYCWFDLPDRELVLVNDTHKSTDMFWPQGHNFDEFVDLNLTSEANVSRFGIDYVMLNYHSHEKSEVSPDSRKQGRLDSSLISVADSGGFQLVTGAVDFINPHKLVEWYNANTDLGMVLDVPPLGASQEEYKTLLRRGAYIQKANNQILLDEKREDLELINVIHGNNWKLKQKFFEVVHDDRITKMALGGEYMHNLVKNTYNLLNAIHTWKDHYNHFHVLGVYSLPHIAMLIRVAKYCRDQGFNVRITSDSSTHMQSGITKTYHTQLGQDSPPKRMIIGDKTRYPSIHSQFNCLCPVCRSIRYEDVLSAFDTATTTFLLATHNAFEMSRYVQQLTEICGWVTDKEYEQLVTSHAKSSSRMFARSEYLSHALNLIRDVEQHGLTSAIDKKYAFYLNNTFTDTSFKELPTLISTTGEGIEEETVEVFEAVNHVVGALDRFEAFHSSEEEKANVSKLHGKSNSKTGPTTVNRGSVAVTKGGLAAQKQVIAAKRKAEADAKKKAEADAKKKAEARAKPKTSTKKS